MQPQRLPWSVMILKHSEVAFRLVKYLLKILTTKHQGEHLIMGATDVLPFVPIKGTSQVRMAVGAKTVSERINH